MQQGWTWGPVSNPVCSAAPWLWACTLPLNFLDVLVPAITVFQALFYILISPYLSLQ